jgi:filamentous hemagglutinin
VDYVSIEYKFVGDPKKVEVDPMNPTRKSDNGSDRLGKTNDGLQGSTSWMAGSNRIENAVGEQAAPAIYKAIDTGRIESWVVTVRPDGSTAVEVLVALGKPKPIDTSKIILPKVNLSGAQK